MIILINNDSPKFQEVKTLQEQVYTIIETLEKSNSRPWIRKLECDIDYINVNINEVIETQVTGDIEINYIFCIKLNDFPSEPEFHGRLHLLTDDGERRAIGSVSGTR